MATQKQYHDLVILDNEGAGTKHIKAKKIVSGILFFLIGIFIGALLIAFWNDKNTDLAQNPAATTQDPSSNNSTDELQSITSITGGSAKDEGCGIESLGRNNPEGCSADSFTDTPIPPSTINSTGITDLNALGDDTEATVNDSDTNSEVTNILDLK